ncbi:MAG TPA: TPM domain-containing protein [Bacteroidota bacterium]|nr:TPM domain-containing protein [Bacteroidota bacterium]
MKHVKKIFSQEDLNAIAHAIGEAEKTTSGEIRVSIRQKRGWRERKTPLEQLAQKEFYALGMKKTNDRTGILIFLLLHDRRFHIYADEGIHAVVQEGTWENIAKEMSEHFSQQKFRDGVIHGVQSVGAVLANYFPPRPGDADELSNEVVVD